MTQAELELLPKELERIFKELEERIMEDIVRRIAINDFSTASSDWQMTRLQQLGKSEEDSKKWIQAALGAADEEIEQIFSDKVYQEYMGHERAYKVNGMEQIAFNNNAALQQLIEATKQQISLEYQNLANSMGFAIRDAAGNIQYSPVMEFYRNTLDKAVIDIQSGAFSYQTILSRTINEMTASGLRWINYESGHHNRVDVAARSAMMAGFRQVQGKINEQVAADLGTDSYEVTYHVGARPDHQSWQGRVWTMQQLIDVCGLGTVTGLHGANCYHDYNAFIPGVSIRTYTDDQLDQMIAEENTPKTYLGKEYTTYEALQQQRKMETAMRKYRMDIHLLEEGKADEREIVFKKAKYQGKMQEYKAFSKAMKLPMQKERIYQDGLKGKFGLTAEEKKVLEKISDFDIMKSGARITNLYSEKAVRFAEMYYKEIRSFSTDVKKIATNLDRAESDIRKVKAYLFQDKSLYDPETNEWRQFDPDCAIAQSWQRLMLGKSIKPHDRTLIEHELLEMEIKKSNSDISHQEAHRLAAEKYDYGKEAGEYYGNLKKHHKDGT